MPTRTGSSVDADGRVAAAAGITLAASMSGSASSECTRVLLNARLDCISGASLSLGVFFIASLQQVSDFDIPEPHFVAEQYSSSAGPFGLYLPSPGTASQAREPDSPSGISVRAPAIPLPLPCGKAHLQSQLTLVLRRLRHPASCREYSFSVAHWHSSVRPASRLSPTFCRTR